MGKAKSKSPAKSSTKRSSSSKVSNASKARPAKSAAAEDSLAARLLYGDDQPQMFALVNPRTNAIERAARREEIEAELLTRKRELAEQFNDAQKALKKVKKWVKAGLFGPSVGCTVGLRQKDGRVVSPLRYVIQVHVPFKMGEYGLSEFDPEAGPQAASANAVPSPQKIPESVDGVLIKVVESRPYRVESRGILADAPVPKSGVVKVKNEAKLKDIKVDPTISLSNTELIGGLPTVETEKSNWGTLGIAFCNRVDESSNSAKYFAVANAHFAPNNKIMVQPAEKPTPANTSLWEIGTVTKKREGAEDKYHVDAALISLNSNRDVVSKMVHDFGQEKFLFASAPLQHGLNADERHDIYAKVFKFGARTLQRIEGFIENPEDDSLVIDGKNLKKVIRARRRGSGTFILGGDSGSALVAPIYDLKTQKARFLVVGLCFASLEGNDEILFACHFSHVIKALQLDIPKTFQRDDWAYGAP